MEEEPMERPSVTLPAEMLDEIRDRREKGSSRSEYIRDAIAARFTLEDDGDWEQTVRPKKQPSD